MSVSKESASIITYINYGENMSTDLEREYLNYVKGTMGHYLDSK